MGAMRWLDLALVGATLFVASCSSPGTDGAPSATTSSRPATPGTTPLESETTTSPTTLVAAAATLPWSDTVPAFALPPPVEPLAMARVDSEGRRCVEVRAASGNTHGVCVDEPEALAVSTTSADTDGTVYVLGLTDDARASHALATTGTTSVRIELRTVDGWPERVFAVPLDFAAETVELVDSSGTVIARQSL